MVSLPHDKYGWIREMHDDLQIVSCKKLSSLYKSPIDLATFAEIFPVHDF